MNDEELARALGECLEALERGETDLQEAISRYPEFEQELRSLIEIAADLQLEGKDTRSKAGPARWEAPIRPQMSRATLSVGLAVAATLAGLLLVSFLGGWSVEFNLSGPRWGARESENRVTGSESGPIPLAESITGSAPASEEGSEAPAVAGPATPALGQSISPTQVSETTHAVVTLPSQTETASPAPSRAVVTMAHPPAAPSAPGAAAPPPPQPAQRPPLVNAEHPPAPIATPVPTPTPAPAAPSPPREHASEPSRKAEWASKSDENDDRGREKGHRKDEDKRRDQRMETGHAGDPEARDRGDQRGSRPKPARK